MSTRTRKHEILEVVQNQTLQCIQFQDIENLGIDATQVASKIHVDRSNVSRILNQLNKSHQITKIHGKPMRFFATDLICEHYHLDDLPSILKSIEELNAMIEAKPSTDSIPQLDYIGVSMNESLHEFMRHINSSILYPNGGLNVLMMGEKYTGKSEISNIILNQYIVENNIKTTQYKIVNCYNFDIEKLRMHLLFENDLKKIKILVLLNIDYLFDQQASYLQTIINEVVSSKTKSDINRLVLATSNISYSGQQLSILKSIFPTIVDMPNFNHRTCKEKAEFLFTFLQMESDRIHLPISVDKEIVNCFITSEYQTNIQNFHNEIKFTIASAVYRAKLENSHLIKLNYDDLSDMVLNNITNINEKYDAVSSIHRFLAEDQFLFIPNSENHFFNQLHHAIIKDNGTIHSQSTQRLLIDLVCSEEIQKSQNIKINTARTMFAKQIYQLLYPEIKNTVLVANENIIFSLFIYLSNLIRTLEEDRYVDLYSETTNTEISVKISKITAKIIQILEKQYNITIPEIERSYISVYLQKSESFIIHQDIPVLLISYNKTIAIETINYLNSLNYKTELDYLYYDRALQKEPLQVIQSMINQKVSELDKGYGVLIFSDMDPLTNLDRKIANQIGIQTFTISHIALPQIEKVLNYMDNNINSLEEIRNLFPDTSISMPIKQQLLSTDDDLLNNIQKHILDESLIFLDFNKAKYLLLDSLRQSLSNLDLNFSKEIATKYIIHCCFAIERSIRNEPLKIKKASTFIKDNLSLYEIVEKSFHIIQNTFGIMIAKSELVLICQMLNEYKSVCKET